MRPPRYYDQDFMAQRWSYKRGSTVLEIQCQVPKLKREQVLFLVILTFNSAVIA